MSGNTDFGQDLMAQALSNSTEQTAMAMHFAGQRQKNQQAQVNSVYNQGYEAGYADAMTKAQKEMEEVYRKYYKAEADTRYGMAYVKNLKDALLVARGKQWLLEKDGLFRKEPTKVYQEYLRSKGFTFTQ